MKLTVICVMSSSGLEPIMFELPTIGRDTPFSMIIDPPMLVRKIKRNTLNVLRMKLAVTIQELLSQHTQ